MNKRFPVPVYSTEDLRNVPFGERVGVYLGVPELGVYSEALVQHYGTYSFGFLSPSGEEMSGVFTDDVHLEFSDLGDVVIAGESRKMKYGKDSPLFEEFMEAWNYGEPEKVETKSEEPAVQMHSA